MSKNRPISARRALTPEEPTLRKTGRGQGCFQLNATCEFISPMFGGGVSLNTTNPHHKDPDFVTPVRGASIRGQLRAWWRRTCGLDPMKDLETLRKREKILWGWASTQENPARGLVAIHARADRLAYERVAVYESQDTKKPLEGYGAAIAYGAFPLQSAQKAADPTGGKLTRWKGQFSISLSLGPLAEGTPYLKRAREAWGKDAGEDLLATLWSEVEKAWYAFVTFGGLGGRTRRGFGAIRQVTKAGEQPAMGLNEVLKLLGWTDRCVKAKGAETDGDSALRTALGRLQSFRQGKGIGRNPGEQANRPGRSRWPEPDAIRRLSGMHHPNHRPVHPVEGVLPRAGFGMPIIFHFIGTGEPKDHSLQPIGCERMGSPLVVRPVQDPNGSVAAVALLLPYEAQFEQVLGRIEFKGTRKTYTGLLSDSNQTGITPLKDYKIKPSEGLWRLYEPFFHYFQK